MNKLIVLSQLSAPADAAVVDVPSLLLTEEVELDPHAVRTPIIAADIPTAVSVLVVANFVKVFPVAIWTILSLFGAYSLHSLHSPSICNRYKVVTVGVCVPSGRCTYSVMRFSAGISESPMARTRGAARSASGTRTTQSAPAS